MTVGSVAPCSSSVPTVKKKARNTISSRPGKDAPDSVVRGRAAAAASETGPRMPAHEITAGQRHGGAGSRSCTRRLSRCGR
jgi:hypothetical protein